MLFAVFPLVPAFLLRRSKSFFLSSDPPFSVQTPQGSAPVSRAALCLSPRFTTSTPSPLLASIFSTQNPTWMQMFLSWIRTCISSCHLAENLHLTSPNLPVNPTPGLMQISRPPGGGHRTIIVRSRAPALLATRLLFLIRLIPSPASPISRLHTRNPFQRHPSYEINAPPTGLSPLAPSPSAIPLPLPTPDELIEVL